MPVVVPVGQRDEADPVAPDSQGEPAVFQGHRVLAENFAAPSAKRLHRRVVIGGDRFQIIGRGRQFLRDLMVVAALLQQDTQQLDRWAEAALPREVAAAAE